MVKAAIFDMDGLLINSEPFWQKAEKIIFGQLGIELSTLMCESTMGYRIDEVVKHWYGYKPWKDKSFGEIELLIMNKVMELIHEEGQLLPGVNYILDFFKSENVKIGLASSSHLRIIKTVLEKFDINNYFEVVHSAEFEEYGKPHPAIFITAAKQLNVKPELCVVFEDSFNGLISAKAARMKTVAIPDKSANGQSKFDIADIRLISLNDFNQSSLNFLKNKL